MGSENPSGADNQQETAIPCLVLDPNWIVGFVDGEVASLYRCIGFDDAPHVGLAASTVFHIYQHRSHREYSRR